MNWCVLESVEDFNRLLDNSVLKEHGVVIFKHSSRCAISSMAKSRLSLKWDFDEGLPIYYLDLIKFRDISNKIASYFNVYHESPQILLIKDKKCVYHDSHGNISVKNLKSALEVKI